MRKQQCNNEKEKQSKNQDRNGSIDRFPVQAKSLSFATPSLVSDPDIKHKRLSRRVAFSIERVGAMKCPTWEIQFLQAPTAVRTQKTSPPCLHTYLVKL